MKFSTLPALYSVCIGLDFYRLKEVIFPPVKAHSETKNDNEIEDREDATSEDEVKKKKHRREKIGFRDRKVRI